MTIRNQPWLASRSPVAAQAMLDMADGGLDLLALTGRFSSAVGNAGASACLHQRVADGPVALDQARHTKFH